ncbi:MAG: hypothetical protein M3R02_16905, partial [Chloroflexota bacterium]|nr:hypothetical protein [Chloroflexota bacterium]
MRQRTSSLGGKMRVVLAVFVLVLLAAGKPASVRAAQQDAHAAEMATIEISRLEVSGRLNDLYGHLHPAAQRLIPREVFIGWYEAEFLPRRPSLITVLSVRFVDWTWPLTGAFYPDTAAVVFSQPFADGT